MESGLSNSMMRLTDQARFGIEARADGNNGRPGHAVLYLIHPLMVSFYHELEHQEPEDDRARA